MFNLKEVFTYNIPKNDKGLVVIEAISSFNPVSWIKNNREAFNNELLKHGGILLRNFNIQTIEDFSKFSEEVCKKLIDYEYASTPRNVLNDKIFTATEYPADQKIPLHNEQSYSRKWPEKLLFFCVVPPEEGGETPIADSRKVLQQLPDIIVNKFKEKQVLYVRNYISGIDLSWQNVFKTSSREKVEEYAEKYFMKCFWSESPCPELTTEQCCQATLVHPVTKEEVWFNQSHLFHVSNLPKYIANFFISELGENNIPRNAYYGDHTAIDEKFLDEIRRVYEKETITFQWKKNDILVLDNILMAHGRMPFKGNRKIAVAMG